MGYVIPFADPQSTDRSLVGGKGANLGRLVDADFPVPPGFTVSTEAYAAFTQTGTIAQQIEAALSGLDYDSADELERETQSIRDLLLNAPMPSEIADAIVRAYKDLGEPSVAVRSSGTAEDMAESSFAGLHDTFLHIQGADAVLEYVRRCWSSLWTARATRYRFDRGYDSATVLIAVVVQEMVASDVSGVMFTANPLTARVDEFVINASWGLGESVVSGEVTPDEYVLSRETLKVKRLTVGSKATEIVRDESGEQPTVTRPVSDALRSVPSLSDDKAADLGQLGRRVMAYYGGLPQDIEWGMADGELYLLQSRDVTGVDFTWDEDIDLSFQRDPEQNDDVLWTNQWARELWTGAITPLFYSVRAYTFENSNVELKSRLGFDNVGPSLRMFKYRRGTCYYNTKVDALHYQHILPRQLRDGVLANVFPDDREAVVTSPFSVYRLVRALARNHMLKPGHGIVSFFDEAYGFVNNTRDDPLFVATGKLDGASIEELQRYSDDELRRYIEARIKFPEDFNTLLWIGFMHTFPFSLQLLNWMIVNWVEDDDKEGVLQTLISGLPWHKMAAETREMWHLADDIRKSPRLTELFEANPGAAFFDAVADDDEQQAFAERYQRFQDLYGHRGNADRDLYYARRCEDRSLDYESFRVMLATDDSLTPEGVEERQVQRREETTQRVLNQLLREPFGAMKVGAFKTVLGYVHRFLILRDDERWAYDKLTLAKKRAFQEVGRRIRERGMLWQDDDFYFLAQKELYEVWEGLAPMRLVKAKIEARRRAFERVHNREEIIPLYLKGDTVVTEDTGPDDGTMRGQGTARGQVTARARIVRNLDHIGRVQKGDILICNGTDPGWASVFLIIQGLVIEAGGVLSHGACLSREYGLPAVTLPNAMNLIPDGALITVNGDTGEITVVEEPEDAPAELELEGVS